MENPPPNACGSEIASGRAAFALLPALLLAGFVAVAIALGIAPRYREDWLLENLVPGVALAVLIGSYARLRFSDLAYVCLFVLFSAHEIGAHYTYSEVPYDAWCREWLGFSPDTLLGSGRNHYDRALHFLYGLLATPAVVDLLSARAAPTRVWRWILPVTFVMSNSVVYELVEWAAALLFGGDLGAAYLGAQGDAWDAQWDMLLAMLGSIVAVLLRPAREAAPAAPAAVPREDIQWTD